jgi:hypothetical protein
MTIHCSACGAPLPTGAKVCPACTLPLTAIAMPTPAPRKGRVSILAIVLYAFAFVLCAFGILWVVTYASECYKSAKPERSASSANAMHATAVQRNASLGGINHQLEEKIEQDLWYKPSELRGWRQMMAERLAQDQQGLRDDQAAHYDDSLVRGDVAFYQAAVARIDARLKQLESRH